MKYLLILFSLLVSCDQFHKSFYYEGKCLNTQTEALDDVSLGGLSCNARFRTSDLTLDQCVMSKTKVGWQARARITCY